MAEAFGCTGEYRKELSAKPNDVVIGTLEAENQQLRSQSSHGSEGEAAAMRNHHVTMEKSTERKTCSRVS